MNGRIFALPGPLGVNHLHPAGNMDGRLHTSLHNNHDPNLHKTWEHCTNRLRLLQGLQIPGVG